MEARNISCCGYEMIWFLNCRLLSSWICRNSARSIIYQYQYQRNDIILSYPDRVWFFPNNLELDCCLMKRWHRSLLAHSYFVRQVFCMPWTFTATVTTCFATIYQHNMLGRISFACCTQGSRWYFRAYVWDWVSLIGIGCHDSPTYPARCRW